MRPDGRRSGRAGWLRSPAIGRSAAVADPTGTAHGGVRVTAGGKGVRRPRGSRCGGLRGVVTLVLIGAVLVTARPASAAGYAPEPYCQLHVLGSLYGDASGNGPANGAAWDPSITSWRLRAGNASTADRFERCARWMVANDVGGNAGATVARRNNSVTLTDFWPAGQGVPFPHGQMTDVVAHASPLGKRAFIMSVIEGEGEVCDPSNATCATAQIADNSRTISGGTNPQYHEHIVALLQPAIDAGLTSAFTATGKGCVPQTVDQLAAGLQAALCIRSSDFAVIKDWPVATCNRVPGYGYLAGYACGQPDAPPPPPPPPPPPTLAVRLDPTSIALGGTSTLTWDGGADTGCQASGAWSGSVASVGSLTVTPTTAGALTYTLTCDNAAGLDTASATLDVTGPGPSIVAFGSIPDPVPKGGPGALRWTSTGLDPDSCKVRVSGTTLAKQLPTNVDSWPIPPTRIKDGTKFTLVCTAGGVKQSAETILAVV